MGAPDATGRRSLGVHSRPEPATDTPGADTDTTERPWTRHADGVLAVGAPEPTFAPESWPPAGATPCPSRTCTPGSPTRDWNTVPPSRACAPPG
ncbi:hypothetical protein GCM10020254_75160 [Streptomyces goshikiensis]